MRQRQTVTVVAACLKRRAGAGASVRDASAGSSVELASSVATFHKRIELELDISHRKDGRTARNGTALDLNSEGMRAHYGALAESHAASSNEPSTAAGTRARRARASARLHRRHK